MSEFVRALIAAGLDNEAVLAILRSPEMANTWVAQLKSSLTPPLFVSPEQQLQNVRMWWGGFFYDNQYRYVEEQMARLAPPVEPLVAWVLVPHFNNVGQTFDWLWKQAVTIHAKHRRWPELKSDSEHLKLLDAVEFTPNCLTWELIDFGAHVNCRPNEVSGSDSAEFGLLAAACHHKEWAMSQGKTVNGTFVPFVNLCGLRVRLSDFVSWARIPCLRRSDAELGLRAIWVDASRPNWACPVRIQRAE